MDDQAIADVLEHLSEGMLGKIVRKYSFDLSILQEHSLRYVDRNSQLLGMQHIQYTLCRPRANIGFADAET